MKYPKARYGEWLGNPQGDKYDPKRCAYEVWGCSWYSRQCSRRRSYGPDGLFCKQHAKLVGCGLMLEDICEGCKIIPCVL